MGEQPRLPGAKDGIGAGLQHERTALAWERTAIAIMVVGIALARYASRDGHFTLGSIGIVQTAAGGLLLFWAGSNDYALHSAATSPKAVPKPTLTQLVGLGTIGFTATALILAVLLVLSN